MMIIDAHVHVWRAAPEYPYPDQTLVSSYSDVPVELLSDYMAEYNVKRAVLIQPLFPGEDNSYVADCASNEPDKYAAVCVVDPAQLDAPANLAYWVTERGCRGLRLRPMFPASGQTFDPEITYPLWEQASTLGTVINIVATQDHLPIIHDMITRYPQVPTIIDHLAHPDVDSGVQSPDFQQLLHLAEFPNVYVKITGYHYYAKEPYPYQDCWPFARVVYETFGPSRLIWGSDFPHVLLKTGYQRSLLLQERAYNFMSEDDLELIMGGNAARLYWGEV